MHGVAEVGRALQILPLTRGWLVRFCYLLLLVLLLSRLSREPLREKAWKMLNFPYFLLRR